MSKVLIIGGGGREHAICIALAHSDDIEKIFILPGNGGTELEKRFLNIDHIDIFDFESISKFCLIEAVDLVIIGPEEPLARGIVDYLTVRGIRCFGPSKSSALIESDKVFAKNFMLRHQISTPKFEKFSDYSLALNFIKSNPFPNGLVIKASGLAAGKGVFVTESEEEAISALSDILINKVYGDSGSTVIIEERLNGFEMSVLAITDGETFFCFPPAQDHKKLLDNDRGPNTGGMGAYAPCNLLSNDKLKMIHIDIIQKTIDNLRKEDRRFNGILYAGLMICENTAYVLEFNCRFGDPEAQVLLPLLKTNFYDVAFACATNKLSLIGDLLFVENKIAICVNLVAEGYPGKIEKGKILKGLEKSTFDRDSYIVHAGTKKVNNATKDLILSGGRVCGLVCISDSAENCWKKIISLAEIISTQNNLHFRRDIAYQIQRSTARNLYASSGVNINLGYDFVKSIKDSVLKTTRSGTMGEIGSFGGLFDLKLAGYKDPVLVCGTDGVGTKLLLANSFGNLESIGQDLVAMCANDVLCHGAEPLLFLDYYSCGNLKISTSGTVVKSIANACVQAGCCLLGGETAEMPDLYQGDDFDLAGFCMGAVDRKNIRPNLLSIKQGDSVLGLSSSGLHSNGFSLIRKLLLKNKIDHFVDVSGKVHDLAKLLLTPTKIYAKSIVNLKNSLYWTSVKSLAHITGGGFEENIPRALPDHLSVLINKNSWTPPIVYQWLSNITNLDLLNDLSTVFNCGIGMILIVDPDMEAKILKALSNDGEQVQKIGTVVMRDENHKTRVMFSCEGLENGCETRESKQQIISQKINSSSKTLVGVLISGSGTNLQALIDHCNSPRSSCKIALVISNVDGVEGLTRASINNIPHIVISHKKYSNRELFEVDLHKALIEYHCELVCLAGFMRVLTSYFVNLWYGKLMNIHPSLLPSFKGCNVHKSVLESGVRITGATVHFVNHGVDTGAIIAQASCPVYQDDTENSLADRVKTEVEHKIFPQALELVAQKKCVLLPDNKIQWKL